MLSISICHSFIRINNFPQLALLSTKRHFNLCLFQKFTSLNNNNKRLPKAVLIAGLNENYLHLIDDILYEVLDDIPPVIILSKDDANLDLSYFLYNLKTLNQRDHLISSTTSTTSILPNLSYPVMILSGYDSNSTISIIRNFKKYTNASLIFFFFFFGQINRLITFNTNHIIYTIYTVYLHDYITDSRYPY